MKKKIKVKRCTIIGDVVEVTTREVDVHEIGTAKKRVFKPPKKER